MSKLKEVNEEAIREILANYYGIRMDLVCLCHDYKFVIKNGDKVRKDFIYAIVEIEEED